MLVYNKGICINTYYYLSQLRNEEEDRLDKALSSLTYPVCNIST